MIEGSTGSLTNAGRGKSSSGTGFEELGRSGFLVPTGLGGRGTTTEPSDDPEETAPEPKKAAPPEVKTQIWKGRLFKVLAVGATIGIPTALGLWIYYQQSLVIPFAETKEKVNTISGQQQKISTDQEKLNDRVDALEITSTKQQGTLDEIEEKLDSQASVPPAVNGSR